MKVLLILMLTGAVALAQTAQNFDPAAAKSTLAEPAKKGKFVPKSPLKSRTYGKNAKGINVEILEFGNGTTEERPYVAIPILFVVGTDELLDQVSKNNVVALAGLLKELQAGGAKFIIQGHTSAEGEKLANQTLSECRARRIFKLLTEVHGLDAACLKTMGFGEDLAAVSEGAPDSQRQQDRRVLVVRE